MRSFPSDFSVTPKSSGLPSSRWKKLLCAVSPASGEERFVWRPLKDLSRSSPGPVLEMQEARLLTEKWQCQLYAGQKLLGATVYTAESSSGLRSQNIMAPAQKPSKSPTPAYLLPYLFPSTRDLTSSSLGLTYFCH